jgi:hypothetical protein
MLAPAFHRRMTLLALVAMLLLLALPTAGRVLAASTGDQEGVWAQMCTMAGLKLVKIAPGELTQLDPQPVPKGPPGSDMPGEDCAYCPVLGGMAFLLLWTMVVALHAPRRPAAPWRLLAPRLFLHPNGLGSRGPPVAL